MIKVILSLILLTFSISSFSKEIYYGSTPELVKISKETIFRFHQNVRTISQAHRFEIKPSDPNDPDYSVLSIRPRFTKGVSKVAFVLSDGSVVNLKLKVVSRNSTSDEPFYDLRPKSMLIERSDKNLPALTVMDFMRSVDSDAQIVGFKRKIKNKWISTGNIRGVKAKLIRKYSGKEYKAFVIKLTNIYKSKKYQISPDKTKFPTKGMALMSLIDEEVLYPKKQGTHTTLLKIVTKPSAEISDLKLSITPLEKKGKRL
jgi:hypothetical protein